MENPARNERHATQERSKKQKKVGFLQSSDCELQEKLLETNLTEVTVANW